MALTPDGSTVAVGGWTGPCGARHIYLFDRVSGALKQRLYRLPTLSFASPILKMPLSRGPSGRENGIRVFDVASGHAPMATITTTVIAELGRPRCHEPAGHDLGRRLHAPVCRGALRRTDRSRRCGHERVSKPFSVAFSPDGKRVPIVCETTNVVVLQRLTSGSRCA